MKPPSSRKKLQKFIGVVNYYRDMWPRGIHTVLSLTKIPSNKVEFKWNNI